MANALKSLKKEILALSLKELGTLTEWCEDRLEEARDQAKTDSGKGIAHADLLKELRKGLQPAYWKKLQVEEAASLMQSFYEDTRVRGCDVEEEQDMLLVEWGTEKTDFYVAFTRQLMPPTKPGKDEEIWQLRIALFYPMTEALRNVMEGNRWFESLKKTDAFARLVYTSKPFTLLGEKPARKTLVTYQEVE
jgi:hypothetical protein